MPSCREALTIRSSKPKLPFDGVPRYDAQRLSGIKLNASRLGKLPKRPLGFNRDRFVVVILHRGTELLREGLLVGDRCFETGMSDGEDNHNLLWFVIETIRPEVLKGITMSHASGERDVRCPEGWLLR